MSHERTARDAGVDLDMPLLRAGNFDLVAQVRDVLFVSGSIAPAPGGGGIAHVGRLGGSMDIEAGQASARGAAEAILASVHQHPGSLDEVVEQFKGKKWQYVSLDPQRVHDKRSVQVPSGHYVDINVSAKDVALRCRRLLDAFGHSESDLEYLYEG